MIMKTLIFSTTILLLTMLFVACDNKVEVPGNISDAFNQEYPNARDVEWEEEGDEFEVEFEVDNVEREITYDMQGNIVETGIEVSEDELPKVTIAYITQNYTDFKIDDADEIERNGTTYIEVEIENGKQEIELLFDVQGEFVEEVERENI